MSRASRNPRVAVAAARALSAAAAAAAAPRPLLDCVQHGPRGLAAGALGCSVRGRLLAGAGPEVLILDGGVRRMLWPGDAARREVTALLPGRDGRLQVGTRDGHVVLDGADAVRERGLAGAWVTAFAAGAGARVWASAWDRGLRVPLAGAGRRPGRGTRPPRACGGAAALAVCGAGVVAVAAAAAP